MVYNSMMFLFHNLIIPKGLIKNLVLGTWVTELYSRPNLLWFELMHAWEFCLYATWVFFVQCFLEPSVKISGFYGDNL